MSFDFAIRVENLSKCYQLYEKPHHRLLQMIMRGHKQYYKEFWALTNVSMHIKKGTTVGIIGRNGSGKSTLLKMICGTLSSTSGEIETNGRIAAILELGSGFNPEFTGRENVYMKASILGLNSDQIDERFESIEKFAEIGHFIDQPVRTYSSGMMVRLAFAVSVNVDPEILVVDEALSVGDERFQRKCFSRIESIRDAGATILFVSHSGATVVQLCDHALLLDDGEKIASGNPKDVYGRYQQILYADDEKRMTVRNNIKRLFTKNLKDETSPSEVYVENQKPINNPSEVAVSGEGYNPELVPTSTISYESRGAVITDPKIENLSGDQVNNLVRGRRYKYIYKVTFTEDVKSVKFGMLIKTRSGIELGGSASNTKKEKGIEFVKKGSEYEVRFDFLCSLNQGAYFLNAGVIGVGKKSEEDIVLHRILDAAMFKVVPDKEHTMTGIIDFQSHCDARYVGRD